MVFGYFNLLAGATYMSIIVPTFIMMFNWASLLIIPAVFLGVFGVAETLKDRILKSLGFIMFLYGTIVLFYAAAGIANPLAPAANFF